MVETAGCPRLGSVLFGLRGRGGADVRVTLLATGAVERPEQVERVVADLVRRSAGAVEVGTRDVVGQAGGLPTSRWVEIVVRDPVSMLPDEEVRARAALASTLLGPGRRGLVDLRCGAQGTSLRIVLPCAAAHARPLAWADGPRCRPCRAPRAG